MIVLAFMIICCVLKIGMQFILNKFFMIDLAVQYIVHFVLLQFVIFSFIVYKVLFSTKSILMLVINFCCFLLIVFSFYVAVNNK